MLVQRHLPAITAQAHIPDILAIDSSKVEVKNVVPSRSVEAGSAYRIKKNPGTGPGQDASSRG
jgi:hypothetical protein